MSNKKLEYNPLFESLTETARKYSRINEEGSPYNASETIIDLGSTGSSAPAKGSSEYKIKFAAEYAVKIFQLIYDEYTYFLNSIKDQTLKQKYATSLYEFVEQNSIKTDLNFDLLGKELITKWEVMNASSEMKNIAASSDNFKKAYDNISKAISKFKLLLSAYSQKYGTELSNNLVKDSIKSFISTAFTTLQTAKQDTKKI